MFRIWNLEGFPLELKLLPTIDGNLSQGYSGGKTPLEEWRKVSHTHMRGCRCGIIETEQLQSGE